MKLNRLETHDRLEHLLKDQSDNVFKGAEECLKLNPLSLAIQEKCPYVYIFAHARTSDDGLKKRLLWQPRISKPKAQTNSYLFRAQSHRDLIDVIWIIPERHIWPQYEKGKITENELVNYSVDLFEHNRNELEKPHPEDYSEERSKKIFQSILDEHRQEIRKKKNQSGLILS
jgi:hypothetical protein